MRTMEYGPLIFRRGEERFVIVPTSEYGFKLFSLDNGGQIFKVVENARFKDDEDEQEDFG